MKELNRILLGLGSVSALAPAVSAAQEAPEKTRPNILFIAVDDLKTSVSPYGDTLARTPSLERIASEGVTFMNNYCQFPLSGPTRASLLTGLRPDHTGVYTLDGIFRKNNPEAVTLPEYFKLNGYETIGIGKIFHPLADKEYNNDPESWTRPYIMPSAPVYVLSEGKPATECVDVPDNAYKDGMVAEAAVKQIAGLKDSGKPFFLAVGFIRPHLPFVAPKKYWDLYERENMPLAEFRQMSADPVLCAYHNSNEVKAYTDIPSFHSFMPGEELDEDIQRQLIHGYYACASYTDAQIGKVLDALEDSGLAENTIVVVWGDHGYHLGDHGLWSKLTNFESPTRTVLMISAPDTKKGVKCRTMTEFVDVFPTLCELAGLVIPQGLDGTSLVRLMNNPKAKVKDYAFMQANRQEIQGYSIRDGRYRYVEWVRGFNTTMEFDPGQVVGREFYDYATDPLETENAVRDPRYRKQVKKMEERLHRFYEEQRESPACKAMADSQKTM